MDFWFIFEKLTVQILINVFFSKFQKIKLNVENMNGGIFVENRKIKIHQNNVKKGKYLLFFFPAIADVLNSIVVFERLMF